MTTHMVSLILNKYNLHSFSWKFNPSTPGEFTENGNLKLLMLFFWLLWRQINSKLSTMSFGTWKLSFLFIGGQINQVLVSGICTKQNFERTFEWEKTKQKLNFSFSSFYSLFFFILIPSFCPLIAVLSLDFIYKVKVYQETLQKVKCFNKWHVKFYLPKI